MEVKVDENDLKAAGAELLTGDGRHGICIHGWEIETLKRSILKSSTAQEWEQKLQTSHLPEMEALPPVEVPAAAQWKFRSKPSQQVILDYDYTFTTPYCGSGTIEIDKDKDASIAEEQCNLKWKDCEDKIDVVALASKEPILFYDEVILYEDELADNGVSLLTVKVRVMPSSWFLLLRFWLRVDGVLIRLRDTRLHCMFGGAENPVILRETCWRESTFEALSTKGHPIDSGAYSDPSIISPKLPVVMHKTQKLTTSA
ncbi:hypothetical protein QN277_001348 [Acacia crassicarpa]|uniref:TIP41-like protein n=1 Tax=Acacia crassicarpa TaxID=499986 RepID=A0AAE1N8F4_9FABA|nr:hypothetical protein QN277_001348 [Acacia crassicarpa]